MSANAPRKNLPKRTDPNAPSDTRVNHCSSGSPSLKEELLTGGMLVLICALPFILGDQPWSLTSIAELGITSTQGDTSKQLILIMLYTFTGIGLFRRLNSEVFKAIGYLLPLLLIWIFASVMWSDLPSVTFRRAIALTGTLTLGIYLAVRWKPPRMVFLLNVVTISVLIWSFAVVLIFPHLGLDSESRLRGVFAHKNSLASFAALGLLCATAGIKINNKTDSVFIPWLAAILSIAALLGARSATPVAAIAVANVLLIYAIKRPPHRTNFLSVGMCIFLFSAAMIVPWIASELGQVALLFGRNADFSGRTSVWSFSTEFVQRRPLLGYGYSSFWNGPAGLLFHRWAHFPVAHAHNGSLQLLLDCGAVALVMFCFVTSIMFYRIHFLLNSIFRTETIWVVSFLTLYFCSNLAETHLLEPNDLYTSLFAYTVVSINFIMQKSKDK